MALAGLLPDLGTCDLGFSFSKCVRYASMWCPNLRVRNVDVLYFTRQTVSRSVIPRRLRAMVKLLLSLKLRNAVLI